MLLHSPDRNQRILKFFRRKYKDDNRQWQCELYDSYADRMFALCMRYLKNKEDAEECLTNGFIKIFKHSSGFIDRGDDSFERWMRTIVINECLMYLRKRRVFFDLHEENDTIFDTLSSDHDIHYQEIYDLVLSLPDGYRTVFSLYHIEGFSHKEISQKCGISENTSKSQLSKARIFLQKKLKQQEVYYESR